MADDIDPNDPSAKKFMDKRKAADDADTDAWLAANAKAQGVPAQPAIPATSAPVAPIMPTPAPSAGYQNPGANGELAYPSAPALPAPPTGGGFPVRGMSNEQVSRANGPQKMDSFAAAQADAAARGLMGPGSTTTFQQVAGGGYAPANMSRFEADARFDPNAGLQRFMNEQAGANNGLANLSPQDRASLVNSYLGMTRGFGEGDKLDLQRYLGMSQEATSARNAGVNERQAGVAERKVADDERKTGWTMSPDRIREQAQLAATQAYIGKMAAGGGSPSPTTISATNDLINGVMSQRSPTGSGGPDLSTQQGAPHGTPANNPAGTGGAGKLLANDPQLAYRLNEVDANGQPKLKAEDKLQMLLQQKGSDWVKQNYPQVMAMLSETDPQAADRLRSVSTPNPVMGFLQRAAQQARIYAGLDVPWSASGQQSMKRANVPLSELWGRETQADKRNAFIRYMNGQ